MNLPPVKKEQAEELQRRVQRVWVAVQDLRKARPADVVASATRLRDLMAELEQAESLGLIPDDDELDDDELDVSGRAGVGPVDEPDLEPERPDSEPIEEGDAAP
jgi:hypothetical protein